MLDDDWPATDLIQCIDSACVFALYDLSSAEQIGMKMFNIDPQKMHLRYLVRTLYSAIFDDGVGKDNAKLDA